MSVLVIGDGLAGTFAAARLSAAGVPVEVLSDRPGATALHSGGFALGTASLARFGLDVTPLGAAVAALQAGLPELDLMARAATLPDQEGVARRVDLAASVHLAAERLTGAVVIDLEPWGQPFAEQLRFYHPELTVLPVSYPDSPRLFGRSAPVLASLLDQPAQAERLAERVAKALGGLHPTALLFPPVLGLKRPDLAKTLARVLGIPVAETLGVGPSTPGLRLREALAQWLKRLGVPVTRARVLSLDPKRLTIQTDQGERRAEGVVLATGGVIPGGLTGQPVPASARPGAPLVEPLTGLQGWTVRPTEPLQRGMTGWIPDAPGATDRAVLKYGDRGSEDERRETPVRTAAELPINPLLSVDPERPYGGLLFRAGVATDARFRPIHPDGAPLHPQLFAVGDVVAGPDRAIERCGSGFALLSAWVAAQTLAQGGPA